MYRMARIALVLTALLFAGCNNNKKQVELRAAFDSIAIGEEKAAIVSRLGKPRDSSYKNILGLTHETLTWEVGQKQYLIELVNDRAVYKATGNLKTKGGKSHGTE